MQANKPSQTFFNTPGYKIINWIKIKKKKEKEREIERASACFFSFFFHTRVRGIDKITLLISTLALLVSYLPKSYSQIKMRTFLITAFSLQSVTSLVGGLALTIYATPFSCLYLLRLLKCCLYHSIKAQTGLAFYGTKKSFQSEAK